MANILATLTWPTRVSQLQHSGVMASFGVGDAIALRTPTKSVAGFVFDRNGAPIVGATVMLVRQVDNAVVARTTSGMAGAYVFPRDVRDTLTYYTVAYSLASGSIQVHGTSDRGLVPS